MQPVRDRLRPLTHPVFWSALALLLVNDHLLKGAGVLPGAVTGKLSDFAGLIVAPVLAVALLGARTPRARALSFATATLPFVAINLSPAAAQLVEQLGAGLGYRAWCDPTDLIALAVLPIAWRVCAPEADRTPTRRSLSLAGLILGAFACMATSVPPSEWFTNAYAVNRTGDEVTIRVAWLEAPVDCELVRLDPQRALSPDAFGDSLAIVLDANETMPLDRGPASTAIPGLSFETFHNECGAALIRADGLDARVLFWDLTGERSVPLSLGEEDDSIPGRVAIESDFLDTLTVTTDDLVADAPLVDRVEPDRCSASSALPLEWSLSSGSTIDFDRPHVVEVLERRLNPDGCTGLTLVDGGGNEHTATLCIPEWAFPWVEEELIRITSTPGSELLIEGDAGSADYRRLSIHRTVAANFEVAGATARIELRDCGGERTACGGFSSPATVSLNGAGAPLLPGDVADLDGATFYLGSAERVGVEPAACSFDEPEVGPQATWLVLEGQRIQPTVVDGGDR